MNMLAAVTLALVPSLQAPAQEADPARPKGPMPRPVAFAVERGERRIEIDGSLIEWPELPALNLSDLRQLSGTGNGAWRESSAASAFVFLLLDEQHLYVAATVKDDWHRALDPGTVTLLETPVADSIVLSFDGNRDTRALGPTPGRREDVELWLSEEASQKVMIWDRLRGSAQIIEGDEARLVVSHDKVLGITTYESRIPWSEILPLDTKAAPGVVFDMQVVVNDFDEGTDPLPQTRIGWTFGCGALIDPCLYGTVQLVDEQGLQRSTPLFPDYKKLPPPRQTSEYWMAFREKLAQLPPQVHDGSKAPEEAGGLARFFLLQELERSVDRFPRVDYVEYCQRIHRRMSREVAGIGRFGLPQFWDQQLLAVSKAAEQPPPAGPARLFRLPQNGWLVRGPKQSFLINPAGANIEKFVWGAAGLVVLTEPLDMTRRNDQLLLRMSASKTDRHFLCHLAFHLPVLSMKDMKLVEPGKTYGMPGRVQFHTLGDKLSDGSVPYSLGYSIQMPGGPSLLVAGPQTRPEEIRDSPVSALILSPRNVRALAVARAANPGVILIDDGFLCADLPGSTRIGLRGLHALQKALLPMRSVLLAPGESWDVVR